MEFQVLGITIDTFSVICISCIISLLTFILVKSKHCYKMKRYAQKVKELDPEAHYKAINYAGLA